MKIALSIFQFSLLHLNLTTTATRAPFKAKNLRIIADCFHTILGLVRRAKSAGNGSSMELFGLSLKWLLANKGV